MISDLSTSIPELLEAVEELIDDPIFLLALEFPQIASFVKDGLLFWNLGHNQGYVVINPKVKKVYRVFETDDKLEPFSDKSLCDPAVSELVLADIIFLVDALSEEMEVELNDSLLDLFNPGPGTLLM